MVWEAVGEQSWDGQGEERPAGKEGLQGPVTKPLPQGEGGGRARWSPSLLLAFSWAVLRNLVYGNPADSPNSPCHLISGFLGLFPLVILWTTRLQISNYFRDLCSLS